jgi:hypothetical protein
MISHSMVSLVYIFTGEETIDQDSIRSTKIVINIYLLIVILFHCPVVLLQDYSQIKKLCR